MKKVLIVITFLMLTSVASSEEVAPSSDSPEFNLFSEFTCFGGTENELYHYDFGAVKYGKRTVVSYQNKINKDSVTGDCATSDDLVTCNIGEVLLNFSKDDKALIQVVKEGEYKYLSTLFKMYSKDLSKTDFILCEQQVLTPDFMQ